MWRKAGQEMEILSMVRRRDFVEMLKCDFRAFRGEYMKLIDANR